MNPDDIKSLLPLSSKAFHILTAFADEPMNGYQLGIRVEETSSGTIRMSPGTLYENVHRLAERELIQEVQDGDGVSTDGRGQRFYEITDKGLELLRAEVARLASDVRLARSIPDLVE